MIVVITSSGGVAKRLVELDDLPTSAWRRGHEYLERPSRGSGTPARASSAASSTSRVWRRRARVPRAAAAGLRRSRGGPVDPRLRRRGGRPSRGSARRRAGGLSAPTGAGWSGGPRCSSCSARRSIPPPGRSVGPQIGGDPVTTSPTSARRTGPRRGARDGRPPRPLRDGLREGDPLGAGGCVRAVAPGGGRYEET